MACRRFGDLSVIHTAGKGNEEQRSEESRAIAMSSSDLGPGAPNMASLHSRLASSRGYVKLKKMLHSEKSPNRLKRRPQTLIPHNCSKFCHINSSSCEETRGDRVTGFDTKISFTEIRSSARATSPQASAPLSRFCAALFRLERSGTSGSRYFTPSRQGRFQPRQGEHA